jgi:hypothetical protein
MTVNRIELARTSRWLRALVALTALAPASAMAIHQLHPHAEGAIAFAAGYTGESWRVADGGLETGSRFID